MRKGTGMGRDKYPPGRSISQIHTTVTLDLLEDTTEQPLKKDTAGWASDWVPRHGR